MKNLSKLSKGLVCCSLALALASSATISMALNHDTVAGNTAEETVMNNYTEGQSLTYDEITVAPGYLNDGIFANGEIVSGKVTYVEPEWIEISVEDMDSSSLLRASKSHSFSFFDSTGNNFSITGLKSLNNNINYSVDAFNVYHRADGPDRPTYDYDNLRYKIVLQKGIFNSEVSAVTNKFGTAISGTFWNLDSTTTYRYAVILIDDIPVQYIASSKTSVGNIVG